MCIVLVTRTKKYSLVLSNRDEFLARPTAKATWWPAPASHILGGRDMARPSHGTWLGITRQGRFVVLTNFREATEAAANGAALSRGEITKEFLMSDKPVEEWIQEVLESGVYKNVGGFSLMCGVLRKKSAGYAVVSNRSTLEKGADWVLAKQDEVVGYECEGLSNSLIHDEWPKVALGKKLLHELIEMDIQDERELIERCFDLLSTNSFTETPNIDTLRNSIFIPRFATPKLPVVMPSDGPAHAPDWEWACCDHPRFYGTRQQTVVLVSREDGRVIYTERTLYDEHAEPLTTADRETQIEFTIEGWDENVR